jgi:hypothetical protein
MKFTRYILFMLVVAAVGLLATGCSEKSSDDSVGASETDEQALTALVAADVEVDDVDSWASDDTGGGGPDEPISPIHWARIAHRDGVTFAVEFAGDSAATITRTRHWNGVLRLVTDTTGGQRTTLDKAMYNTCVRKAHAVRIARTRVPRDNWRITEITPEVLQSTAPNPYTVDPIRLQIDGASDAGPIPLLDLTDPLNTYLNRETLPTVGAAQELTVMATLNSTAVAFAVVHPFAYRRGPLHRLALHDDGVAPDVTAGDGIYSGTFFAPARAGLYHAAADFMDWETMFDSDGAYDAGGWAIPYRVVAE